MSDASLSCEQAIFTSIRTPMGEGYRIVASSKGLRPEEQRLITRNSPSHGGLCQPSPEREAPASGVDAMAFYPVSNERLCVSFSCLAGAEHTGRGGQRVYTHCIVLDRNGFSRCGYNPFNVLRAAIVAGLATPQLDPPSVLPPLELPVLDHAGNRAEARFHETLGSATRLYILQRFLDGKNLTLTLADGWLETAEAILLGVPGSLRAALSFSAGQSFSLSRSHHLDILFDTKGQAKARLAGQPIEYIDPLAHHPSVTHTSAWLRFVARHWDNNEWEALTQRTGRSFHDIGPVGRERIGGLFNAIDEAPNIESVRLIAIAAEHLELAGEQQEPDLIDEFLHAAGSVLRERIPLGSVLDAKQGWPGTMAIASMSSRAADFALPLIDAILKRLMDEDPLAAAETALDVAREVPSVAASDEHLGVLDHILERLASWAEHARKIEMGRFLHVCKQWTTIRPDRPSVVRLNETACIVSERQSITPAS